MSSDDKRLWVEYRHSRPLCLHPPYHHQWDFLPVQNYFHIWHQIMLQVQKVKKSNDFGKTAMNYARSNGLTKIIKTLEYMQWKILYSKRHVYYKITMNIVAENITFIGSWIGVNHFICHNMHYVVRNGEDISELHYWCRIMFLFYDNKRCLE
jgi:hypothetical protein